MWCFARHDNGHCLCETPAPMTVAQEPVDGYTAKILAMVTRIFADRSHPPRAMLFYLLRLAAKWRAEMLRVPALRATGGIVASGPFAGMKFERGAAEGCFIPKLLGCYESELHPYWEGLRRQRSYRTIVDIGAAEGYYAVGLARYFPEALVVARDTNAGSHAMVRDIAQSNGVADRVVTGGHFAPADFNDYADQRTLVLCDIEGAEQQLLDPAIAPALRRFDIVVETHDGEAATILDLLVQRFRDSHDIAIVRERMRDIEFPPGYQPRDSIDRLISVWEYRSTPTPWLVMRARDFPA